MHDSDSQENKNIESPMLEEFKKKLDIKYDLSTSRIQIKENEIDCMFEFDFHNIDNYVLGEIYSGRILNAGQRKKLSTDCLKFLAYEKIVNKLSGESVDFKKYIVVRNEKIEDYLTKSHSWLSNCIRIFDIKVVRVKLTPEQENILNDSEALQQKGNIINSSF